MENEFPLQLKHYFFTHLTLEAVAGHKPLDHVETQHKLDCRAVKSEEGSDRYFVWLELSLNEEESENVPYTYSFATFGDFELTQPLPEDAALQLVRVSGFQLLLVAIRERLSLLSGCAPWGEVHLPFLTLPPESQEAP